jgi:hypothetical protein
MTQAGKNLLRELGAAFFGVPEGLMGLRRGVLCGVIVLCGLIPLQGMGQETVGGGNSPLKEIIEGIFVPAPAIEEKRMSYSFLSDTRRLYSKDPIDQRVETLKTTVWTAAKDKVSTYQEIIFPSPPLYLKIQTPDQLWYLSCSKKWAVQSDSYVTADRTPKEITELFSYFADIKFHPDSKYKLVKEDANTWTIDERPSPEFSKTLVKYITTFGKLAGIAPEITESPHLELIRVVIDKTWHLPTSIEIYGQSGAMWYQRKISEIRQVPLDKSLFEVPKGCEVLGFGTASLQKMFSLEKEEKTKEMTSAEIKLAKREEREKERESKKRKNKNEN